MYYESGKILIDYIKGLVIEDTMRLLIGEL